MTYEYEDEYPDGSCVECGEATEEDYHRYCPPRYAEQNGWSRPVEPPEIEPSVSDRRFVRLLERVRDLERRVGQLEREPITRRAA